MKPSTTHLTLVELLNVLRGKAGQERCRWTQLHVETLTHRENMFKGHIVSKYQT